MNKIKQIILFGIAVLMCSCQSKQMEPSAEAVSVPLGGNTYVTAGKESEGFDRWYQIVDGDGCRLVGVV